MRRNFKIGKYKFDITDTPMPSNLSEPPYKYDLMIFSEKYNCYRRVCGCNTLQQGREYAETHAEILDSCE